MEEDPYKEYKLWQKNLSNEYQNKLEPMWNRLITFNNREYGIIGLWTRTQRRTKAVVQQAKAILWTKISA